MCVAEQFIPFVNTALAEYERACGQPSDFGRTVEMRTRADVWLKVVGTVPTPTSDAPLVFARVDLETGQLHSRAGKTPLGKYSDKQAWSKLLHLNKVVWIQPRLARQG